MVLKFLKSTFGQMAVCTARMKNLLAKAFPTNVYLKPGKTTLSFLIFKMISTQHFGHGHEPRPRSAEANDSSAPLSN